MTYTTLKLALGLGAGLLLASGALTVALSQSDDGKPTPQEIAKQVQDKYASLSSYRDTGKTIVEMGGVELSTVFDIRLERPVFYRIEWTQTAGGRTVKGAAWSAGDGDFLQIQGPGLSKYSAMQTRQLNLIKASGLSGSVAQVIPSLFFNDSNKDFLSVPFARQDDEKIGDTDCYVLTRNKASVRTTLWIGRKDFLIHQIRRDADKVDNAAAAAPITDSSIGDALRKQNEPVTPEAVARMRRNLEELQKHAQELRQQHSIQSATSTEIHENISINESMSKANFVHAVPRGLKPSSKFP